MPADVIAWKWAQALVAAGSPFAAVRHDGREIRISRCHNAFILPGMGQEGLYAGAKVSEVPALASPAVPTAAPTQEAPAMPGMNMPGMKDSTDAPTKP